MESTFSFVIGLLTAALSLLGLVEKHPELPQESREQAQQVAEQAITQATQALAQQTTENAKRVDLTTRQITAYPQNSGQSSPSSQATQLRAEKDIPTETYQRSSGPIMTPGDTYTTVSEPYFGEGVVVSAHGTERIPQNVVDYAFYDGKQQGDIVRLRYVNRDVLEAFSSIHHYPTTPAPLYPTVPIERYEGGTVYALCWGDLKPVGTVKTISKVAPGWRCSRGAVGLITKQDEDVPVGNWNYSN